MIHGCIFYAHPSWAAGVCWEAQPLSEPAQWDDTLSWMAHCFLGPLYVFLLNPICVPQCSKRHQLSHSVPRTATDSHSLHHLLLSTRISVCVLNLSQTCPSSAFLKPEFLPWRYCHNYPTGGLSYYPVTRPFPMDSKDCTCKPGILAPAAFFALFFDLFRAWLCV